MIDKLSFQYHPMRPSERSALEGLEPLLEQVHDLLEQAGYRPFGRIDLVLPGNSDRMTISWRRDA